MANDKNLVTYEDLVKFKTQIMSIILQYKCGYYDSEAMYNVGDTVFYNKKVYVCVSDSLGDNPPTDTDYWEPLVA